MDVCVFVKSRLWPYYQYPENDVADYKLLLNFSGKRERNEKRSIPEQLLIHRSNKHFFYLYVRRLGNGQRVGFGIRQDCICNDFDELFKVCRSAVDQLCDNNLVIRKKKNGAHKLISKKIIPYRSYNADVYRTNFNLFIDWFRDELNNVFSDSTPLPIGSLAIAGNSIVQGSLKDHNSGWFVEKLEQGYHNVYITPKEELPPIRYEKLLKILKELLLVTLIFLIIYSCINYCASFRQRQVDASEQDNMTQYENHIDNPYVEVESVAVMEDSLEEVKNDTIKEISVRNDENPEREEVKSPNKQGNSKERENVSKEKVNPSTEVPVLPKKMKSSAGNIKTENKKSESRKQSKSNNRKNQSRPKSGLSNAERYRRAINKKDWSELKRLADKGYTAAYIPLAKHYLRNTNQHYLANKYARKAKAAGIAGADEILKELELLDY